MDNRKMGKKLVALLVVCAVVAATLTVHDVEATAHTDTFKNCVFHCHAECKAADYGYTFCGGRCDEECSAREAAAKANAQLH